MKIAERRAALKELARLNPHAQSVGNLWKNPFNPRSTGIRFTNRDYAYFRDRQRDFISLLEPLPSLPSFHPPPSLPPQNPH